MKKRTDKQRLDFLQNALGKSTGNVICRWSVMGRGWRLHETTQTSCTDVREAIDKFITEEDKKDEKR